MGLPEHIFRDQIGFSRLGSAMPRLHGSRVTLLRRGGAAHSKELKQEHLTQQVKQGAEQALASLTQGWRELKDRASGALTHFQSKDEKSGAGAGLPSWGSWGFMAADTSDGKDSVVVRLEAPGMSRSDFKIELYGETLSILGEKRIERDFHGDGRYSIQSSYGSFRRVVPLPASVNADRAKATYRDGVLRIVLPKTEGAPSRRLSVQVN